MKVQNVEKIEKLLHETFGEHRVNPKREFFKIPIKRIIAALQLTNGKIINVNEYQIEEVRTEEMEPESSGVTSSKRKDITTFSMLQIPIGAELSFIKNDEIKCKVINEKQVEFEGKRFSLSGLAYDLLIQRYSWKASSAVNGFWYFKYEGEVLVERRRRLESDSDEIF
jgi:hypothetical protein